MLKDELINELKIKCIKMMELTFNDVNIALEAIKNHTTNKVNDDTIDNYHMEIESECLKILLKEQVYSKDLRIVTGILKLVDDIERIGDHAEDLLWCNSKLSTEEKFIEIKNLDILLSEISEMVTLTLKSYLTEDIELANNLIRSDDNIDKLYLKVLDELEEKKTLAKDQNLIIYDTLISKYLERIADHLVNINEWIVYIKNGYYKSKVIL